MAAVVEFGVVGEEIVAAVENRQLLAFNFRNHLDANVPRLAWLELDWKMNAPVFIRGLGVGVLNSYRELPMKLAFAPIPLMPVTMRCPIVEDKFPGAAGALPLAFQLAPLLALVNFGLVGKIGIEFDGEIKFAGRLREVGDVDVFVQPNANCSRNAEFNCFF